MASITTTDHAEASHDVAAGGHDAHVTNTGISNEKLAMWGFLGSECLLFGALISTYLLYKNRSVNGPYPEDVFDVAIDLHGWTYASCPDAQDGEVCIHAPQPKDESLPWTPRTWRMERASALELLQTSRGQVFGVDESRLVAFARGRVETFAEDIAEGAELLGVDVAGRPLIRDETGLVRRELDGSWTTLRPTGE